MADYYEIPGGLAWVKSNLKVIIGNQSLDEIMAFGDRWRSRGHIPLVHVLSPAMDEGRMWDNHVDHSGMLDAIPSHIDLFIVDFNSRNGPQLPKIWWTNEWLLWEYRGGYVRFNGSRKEFVSKFGIDPESASTQPQPQPQPPAGGGGVLPVPVSGVAADVNIHLKCPHCGNMIF